MGLTVAEKLKQIVYHRDDSCASLNVSFSFFMDEYSESVMW